MDTELERDGVEIMGAASQEAGWRSNAWPSHTSMLEAAGLQAPTPEGVPGDGACAYWSLLATMDGGLPRTTFAPGWQPLAGRAADEAARAAMCQLRAQVVQWLLAPAQRRLLRTEPGCTRSFAQYAAGRLEGCDRRIRDMSCVSRRASRSGTRATWCARTRRSRCWSVARCWPTMRPRLPFDLSGVPPTGE